MVTKPNPVLVTVPGKMPFKEFVYLAVDKLRNPPYKGINTVISGFNSGFRKYYGDGVDVVATVQALEQAGEVYTRPAGKGGRGVILYKIADKPERGNTAEDALSAMGL